MGYNRGYREWLHLPLFIERDIIVNAAVAILRGQKLQGVVYLEGRFKSRYYSIVTRLVLLSTLNYTTVLLANIKQSYARIDQFTTIKSQNLKY